jgi:hypothetical protein
MPQKCKTVLSMKVTAHIWKIFPRRTPLVQRARYEWKYVDWSKETANLAVACKGGSEKQEQIGYR